MSYLIDLFLHLDVHLAAVIAEYGAMTHALLALVVFCETGLVVTPFLPGDSLLFAAGAFAAQGALELPVLLVLLFVSAILGDAVNYHLGKHVGSKVVTQRKLFGIPVNPAYFAQAEQFYAEHGKKTIVLARFFPIVRTFAPFVAGVGKMPYSEFLVFNIAGACIWVMLFVLGGYFFGNLPFVRDHFSFVILGVVILSLIPMMVRTWRRMRKARTDEQQP